MAGTADRPGVNQPYLFVSYASADRDRVLPIVDALIRAGAPVWIDREEIHGGANYGRAIAEAIKGAAAFVLMASSLSLASRNVKQEIAVAWEYERAYLPLLLEAVTIPDDLKYWLTAAQWIEVLDKPEAVWLPTVLAALAPFGIAPKPGIHEEIHLAGRDKELALLREKLASAKQVKGGLVLIGGEAGVGKTTLAEAALREARAEGFIVLEGHCFDLAETPPYGAWVDLFLHLPDAPAMPPLPEAFHVPGTVGTVASQMALFAQVEGFLKALTARQPVVVLLDDLHWADPASLDLLRFLARSIATLPVLMFITYRSDELTRRHPLSQRLPHLAREMGTERIDLGTLDDDAIHTLVHDRYHLSDAEAARLVAYLQRRAEGNALFVGELLRSLEEVGTLRYEESGWVVGVLDGSAMPPLLRQVIEMRLSRLEEKSQRLLAIAAVIGHAVPLAIWAAVSDVDEETILAVIEEATPARLVAANADGLTIRFVHALIREALYEGVLPTRRRQHHRRVGEALATTRDPDPDAVAYHFQRANDARAVVWLTKAGERAQAAYAWLTAAARYEAALTLIAGDEDRVRERARLLFRAAIVMRFDNDRQSLAYLDEAMRLAQGTEDRPLAARIQLYHGLVQCFRNNFESGVAELRAGADALDALTPAARADSVEPDGADATVDRGTVVLWLAQSGHLSDAETMGERYIAGMSADAASGVAGARFADAYSGLAIVHAYRGRPDAARRAYERSRDLNLAVGHLRIAAIAVSQILLNVVLRYQADDVAGRTRLATELEHEWSRLTEIVSNLLPRAAWSAVMAVDGCWESIGRADAENSRHPEVDTMRAYVALGQGDRELASALIDRWLPAGVATSPGSVRLEGALAMQRVAAQLALTSHDLSAAKAWLDAHDRWLAWSGAVLGQSEGEALWAQYHRQASDREKAHEHAERALAHASEPRQPLALITAHRLLGELDTDAGRFDDTTQHLGTSLQLADACDAPYERALTLLAMSELKTAIGDMDAARTLLDEVKSICAPLGAKPALARAETLAAKLGAG